jgi:hypothetical protein
MEAETLKYLQRSSLILREVYANMMLSYKNQVIAIIMTVLLCFVSVVQANFEASAITAANKASFTRVSLFGGLENLFGPSETTTSNQTAGNLSTAEDLSGSSVTISNQTLGNLSTFNSPSLGIEFLYPTLWLNVTQLAENFSASIQYILPPDNQSQPGGAVITVSVANLLNATSTLEEYVNFNEQILNATAMSYNVIESQNTVLAGNPSISKVFTMTTAFPNKDGNVTNVNLKGIQMYGIQGSKAYSILLIAEELAYDAFLPVFQRMADSFEVTRQEFMVKPISEITKEQSSSLFNSRVGYSSNLLQMHSLDKSQQISGSANIINVQMTSSWKSDERYKLLQKVFNTEVYFSGAALATIGSYALLKPVLTGATLTITPFLAGVLTALTTVLVLSTIGYIYLDWALAERCGLPPGSLVAETCGAIEENVLSALEDLDFDITKPS